MKGFGDIYKKTKKINKKNKPSKEEIIKQATQFHLKGNIKEAAKYYQYFINQGWNDKRVFSNYGTILQNSGQLQEAELNIRKAIEIDPNYANAYSNLGIILKDFGKLQEAEISYRKAIELDPNLANAYSNLGNILKDLGKFQEAELNTRKAIELDPNLANAYSNLGGILKDLGKFQEAELNTRKAIEINPNFSDAYSNLGGIMKYLGKSKEAELYLLKAIEIDPNLAKPYFLLSTLSVSPKQKNWEEYLFTTKILKNQKDVNYIDIYFARANILEGKFNFTESANMFKKANSLNRKKYGSNYIPIKNQMRDYYKISQRLNRKEEKSENLPTSIFIVGLPRSGKTITESILACNKSLLKCGEDNALSIAVDRYLNTDGTSNNQDMFKIYRENISKELSNESFICSTTPSNYIYTGLIASQIPNSKIIYCFRNPLDTIKEMYCSNLMKKFTFKTSLVESAKILLSINKLMEDYKIIYNSKIYFLNYDDLVLNPKKEIKSLLSWLGWEYDKKYLSPQLDPTTYINSNKINTAINTKYLNIWKNYKNLLQPATEIISMNDKYRHIIS